MVKVFNPEKSDISEKIINFLLLRPDQAGRVKEDKIEQLARSLFEDTNSIHLGALKAYFGNELHFPEIELKKFCHSKGIFGSKPGLFPARYDTNEDKIKICANLISHEKEVTENMVREIFFANFIKKQANNQSIDSVVEGYLRGCRAGMSAYFSEPSSIRQTSELCAEYIVKYRDFNNARFPVDQWSRLVKKKVAEISASLN